MPAFLMRAATERAMGKGTSFSRWIGALVQSHLTRRPVLTETELLALEASTRELAAIGRNINQIARVLNEAYFQTERIRLDKLNELSRRITQTREAIGALVRASRNSWRTDECR
ncbi:plasmid mobilization relaxosome protein MobC [Massilia cellulosiltytica]|nr:plasmid mobilization relaxosome protein MobC [Telluria cellulosilytica]